MVHYGQDEKFILAIPNIDHEPEIAGVKIMHFPPVVGVSSMPLWFDSLGLAVLLLFSLVALCLFAARREAEGRPITLNAKLIAFLLHLPSFIKNGLFPSIAAVDGYSKEYRR